MDTRRHNSKCIEGICESRSCMWVRRRSRLLWHDDIDRTLGESVDEVCGGRLPWSLIVEEVTSNFSRRPLPYEATGRVTHPIRSAIVDESIVRKRDEILRISPCAGGKSGTLREEMGALLGPTFWLHCSFSLPVKTRFRFFPLRESVFEPPRSDVSSSPSLVAPAESPRLPSAWSLLTRLLDLPL